MKQNKKNNGNANLKNVIVIILVIVCICLLGYGIKYLVDNYKTMNSDSFTTNTMDISHGDGSNIDSITQPDPGVKVNSTSLPKVKGKLTELDFSNFKKLFKTSMRSILVLEKTGCSYCEAFEPEFVEALNNIDVDAYKINITNLSDDEYSSLLNYVAFKGTPTTYIIENGKVVHSFSGYAEKDIIESFLDLYYLR